MPESLGERMLQVLGPAQVINLVERADRRAEMRGEMARIGLPEGHPGWRFFAARRPADKGEFPTLGTRGCFESHLAVLRAIAEGPSPRGLILEDDADFTAQLEAGLALAAAQPWDIFFGFYAGKDASPPQVAPGLLRPRPADPLLTTHFMAVRREVAAALVPFLEGIHARPMGHPEGGAMHVDGAYNWFRRAHPDVIVLAPAAAMARQRPSASSIHAPGWADRLPALAPLMTMARHLKRRVGRHRA